MPEHGAIGPSEHGTICPFVFWCHLFHCIFGGSTLECFSLKGSPCRKRSPAKRVWQKSDEKVTEASEKVTRKWPKEPENEEK